MKELKEIYQELRSMKTTHQLVGLWAIASICVMMCCEHAPLSTLVPVGINAIASLACVLRIQYRNS